MRSELSSGIYIFAYMVLGLDTYPDRLEFSSVSMRGCVYEAISCTNLKFLSSSYDYVSLEHS